MRSWVLPTANAGMITLPCRPIVRLMIPRQLLRRTRRILVLPVPVRALHDEHIEVFERIRVADDGHVFSAEVAGVSHANRPESSVDFQEKACGSKDMSRVLERRRHSGGHGKGLSY